MREKRDGDLVVFGPVELEPAVAGARGGGDVLNGGGRGCGECIWEAELCGDSRNPNFLVRVEDFLNAHGCDDKGGIIGRTEEVDAEVTVGYWA